VNLESRSENDFSPKNPEKFRNDLANKINLLLESPDLAKKMGEASRKRAESVFSWKSIAEQTVNFYKDLTRGLKKN
jgi:glycosyltransferase involved in cell wall biosynthesis